MIPMVDLQQQYQQLQSELEPVLVDAARNAHYVMGPNVKAFENEVAEYLGVKHALGVASGTDALHLALLARGIGSGDEVITPSFTFIATVEAILYVGATPVFIDIDPLTFNLAIDTIPSLITDKTKAIMPVHLYGNPVDMAKLMPIAEHYQLAVIEDCAQSFGAMSGDKQTGAYGDVGCYSFYPSKNLSCFGDGGLVVTNDEKTYATLTALRNHGSFQRYHHQMLGYNSRLDEIQAAILRVKLRHIDRFNQQRQQAAQHYTTLLASTVTTPTDCNHGSHVFHQYTILHSKRDEISQALSAHNIANAIYYPIPIHQQALFSGRFDAVSLPITESITTSCLSLPMFPELSETQINQIVNIVCETVA